MVHVNSSEERLAAIAALGRNGASVLELAQAFQMHENKVTQILIGRGVRPRKSPLSRNPTTTLVEFLTEHASSSVVNFAQRHGANVAVLHGILGRYPNSHPRTPGVRQHDAPNDRAVEIMRRRVSGATLDQIAQEQGVTRERVRQILANAGGPTAREVQAIKSREDTTSREKIVRKIRAVLAERPGLTISELAHKVGIDSVEAQRALPRDCRAFVIHESSDATVTWTDEDIRNALQKAATYEFPLTVKAYETLLESGEVRGPSSVRLYQRFGSWTAACNFSEVEPGHAFREDYQSTWTDDDILAFVQEYLHDADYTGSISRYDDWRVSRRPDAPSSGTIRARLGGWGTVKRKVFEAMKAQDTPARKGPESSRLDDELASLIEGEARESMWGSVSRILENGVLAEVPKPSGQTILALGYVQSGKTTSITALTAAAADQGYGLIVAMLGSTNLLLDQNRERLESALGIGSRSRSDYRWVSEANLSGKSGVQSLNQHLDRGRAVFVPVLKHAGRIRDVAEVLAHFDLGSVPALIIDDEADQVSLNTAVDGAESKTYSAIRALRESLPSHLYVQYTATPYAPLLLDAQDLLKPDAVEFLEPGAGYVGGREFFVDHAEDVVRTVPQLDEQATKDAPLALPASLTTALASFVAGAAVLLGTDESAAPVSMLVHSTARNDVQQRYHFLLGRQLAAWRAVLDAAESFDDLPGAIQAEYRLFVERGGQPLEGRLIEKLLMVVRETTMWLVNSQSALDKVKWGVSRCHLLIGGNKLDRGFTVEGLTVTYMNRPTSSQVDTLEQRARAFGYRGDQLPYCQFFASKKTIRSLRDIVFTEYDLRGNLRDTIDGGGTVAEWAAEVGLLLPEGMRPTRETVVAALSSSPFGWHSLRRPSFERADIEANRRIVDAIGLLAAPSVDYGRLSHRTLTMALSDVVEHVVGPWRTDSYSPSWRHAAILDALRRHPDQRHDVPILLMEESGNARIRKWDDEIGFVNLFQGRDAGFPENPALYPGDSAIPAVSMNPDGVVLQVHRVLRRNIPGPEILALAIYLGSRHIVTKPLEATEDV